MRKVFPPLLFSSLFFILTSHSIVRTRKGKTLKLLSCLHVGGLARTFKSRHKQTNNKFQSMNIKPDVMWKNKKSVIIRFGNYDSPFISSYNFLLLCVEWREILFELIYDLIAPATIVDATINLRC